MTRTHSEHSRRLQANLDEMKTMARFNRWPFAKWQTFAQYEAMRVYGRVLTRSLLAYHYRQGHSIREAVDLICNTVEAA